MSSRLGRKIHLVMMAVWAAQMVAVWFIPAGWRVLYLVQVSIYANIVGHWGGWSAERPVELEGEDSETK